MSAEHLSRSAPTRDPRDSTSMPGTLRLVSYNIHRCIGADGRHEPARIREALRALNADVVALQEVEVSRHDPEFLNYLCADSDWQHVQGVTLKRHSGDYGNAVLTRLPVREVRRQDLSFRSREPRGALHLDLDVNGSLLHVVATHFGLRPSERRFQAEALAAELDLLTGAANRNPTIVLMGDFNEWFLWGRALRHLGGRFVRAPAPRTFPARLPLFALDRIWATPCAQSFTVEAVSTPLTRIASDHLPLLARLRLR